MFGICRFVEPVDNLPASVGDPGCNEASVDRTPLPAHETSLFHPVEQPGRIWHAVQQPLSDFVPAETFRLGASQDPQHIVLSAGDPVGLEHLLERVGHDVRGAQDVELRLLAKGPERLVLLDLVAESRIHATTIVVMTITVKAKRISQTSSGLESRYSRLPLVNDHSLELISSLP